MKRRLEAWLREQEATENQLVWLERVMIVSALCTTLFVGVTIGLRIGYHELGVQIAYPGIENRMPEDFADHWRFFNAASLLSVVCLAMSGISVWTSELVGE